nr:hypothetical protein [Pseudomonadota bacterium]
MAVESTNINFYQELPKLLPSHEVESSLRATKQGLFVHEDLVVKLIEVYKKWLKEVAGSDVSEDKCIRKLFGDDESKLYYVLD